MRGESVPSSRLPARAGEGMAWYLSGPRLSPKWTLGDAWPGALYLFLFGIAQNLFRAAYKVRAGGLKSGFVGATTKRRTWTSSCAG